MTKFFRRFFLEKKDIYLWVFSFFTLVAYFVFGSLHLGKFSTADEHYWIFSNTTNNHFENKSDGRIAQYWDSVLKGDWKGTRINDKPGVSLAYVSGIGVWFQRGLLADIFSGSKVMSQSEQTETINLYYRYPLLIFNGLFSVFLAYLVFRITSKKEVALIFLMFTLLSPILLGISQIINPDSLLWVFVFATMLSFMLFLREGKKGFAFMTAVFFGLSMLTKYSSIILFPFLFLILLIRAVYLFKSGQSNFYEKLAGWLGSYFAISFGALLIYAILMPDNIVRPEHFWKGSLGFDGMPMVMAIILMISLLMFLLVFIKAGKPASFIFKKVFVLRKFILISLSSLLALSFILVLLNASVGADFLGLHSVDFDASSKSVFKKFNTLFTFFVETVPLIFSLTPVVLFFVFSAWIRPVFKKSRFEELILVLSLFVVVFYAASIFQELFLMIRYSIMLYPVMMLLAAIGAYELLAGIASTRNKWVAVFSLILVVSFISLWRIKPFYFNYTNFFLPKEYMITDAWGYGGYEAAQYLNSLPNAKNLRVWSDYNGFCDFFDGYCVANYLTMKNIQKEAKGSPELPRFDYFVSSRRGVITGKGLLEDLKEKYGSKEIWEMTIGGREANFIRIYENNL